MVIDLSFYSGKNVFITGHTGFKGSWLSKILINAGANVYGYSLSPPTTPNLYEICHIDKNMTSIIGDIRDKDFLKKNLDIVKPEIVFHMAAQSIVKDSYENPVLTYETNVLGTVNLLECIRLSEYVKSFVNVTTDKVYENKELYWGYRENENLCGIDPYSNSKSCSELVTYSYKKSFFNNENSPAISTARSGNVIGGGDFSNNRIIPDCIRYVINNEPIIVRNPNSIRPYQHVLECLSGYLLLAMKQYDDKPAFEGNYNFGPDDDSCITNGALVNLFCSLWRNVIWMSKSDNGPHEASYLKLDCSKAKTILNWEPKWNIQTAMEKLIEWTDAYLNHEDINPIMDMQINEYFNIGGLDETHSDNGSDGFYRIQFNK